MEIYYFAKDFSKQESNRIRYNFTEEEYQKYLECEAYIEYKTPLQKAIEILQEELKDPDYFYAWQANIAVAFQDLIEYSKLDLASVDICLYTRDRIHELSNKAAINFLNLLKSNGKTQ